MNTGLDVSVDVMFINKLTFLVSVSKQLKFNTIEYIPNRSERELARSISKIIDIYKQRGFSIHTMYMDPDFNFLDRSIVGTYLNKTSTRDHVPDIERQIQVVKDRMRAVHGDLPYDCMNSCMLIELGKYVVTMINAFPPNSGLSRTYSPRTIMMGK